MKTRVGKKIGKKQLTQKNVKWTIRQETLNNILASGEILLTKEVWERLKSRDELDVGCWEDFCGCVYDVYEQLEKK